MKSITAAVLTKVNSRLKIIKKINFLDLKRGQVLVKIKYTAICGSQIFEIKGLRDNKKFIPHMLGHEATGVVLRCGSGVKKIKKNDKVILSWINSKGIDSEKPYYYSNKIKKINAGSLTTFSNYSIVSENKVLKLPSKLNFKNGVLLGCCFSTGAGMIMKQCKLSRKKKVLILGLGGVGLSALFASLYYNPQKIFCSDKINKKINFIKSKIKNDKVVFLEYKDLIKNSFKLKFDYVIETTGSAESLGNSLKYIHNNGKVIFATHPKKKIVIDPYELILGKKIEGSWGGKINFEKDLKNLVKILLSKKNIENIFFSKEYEFKDINSAINDLKNGKVVRPLIKL